VMRLFIDSNVFYNLLFATELTATARRVLEEHESADLYTSFVVVNEVLYVSTFKYYRDRGLVKGRYSFRRALARHGYPRRVVAAFTSLLEELGITLLSDWQDLEELLEVMLSYRLQPSDAQIAVTCRRHGIGVIATFDDDFRRVPWLKVVP